MNVKYYELHLHISKSLNLITNSKLLSANTVINTGSTFPGLSCVLALNCLQKSMMLSPLAPSAGPIGGAGFACPPASLLQARGQTFPVPQTAARSYAETPPHRAAATPDSWGI